MARRLARKKQKSQQLRWLLVFLNLLHHLSHLILITKHYNPNLHFYFQTVLLVTYILKISSFLIYSTQRYTQEKILFNYIMTKIKKEISYKIYQSFFFFSVLKIFMIT